jgi:myo-inositol-1-phosphate synthase
MIKIAIVGLGNCASFLIQSIEYYKNKKNVPELAYPLIGKYKISDIKVVCAIDVDSRKVNKDISEAIFEPDTINTVKIADVPKKGIKVIKGPVLDGIGEYLSKIVKINHKQRPVNVIKKIKESGAEILINYLPTGSYKASRYYANAALKSNCAFINCIPEFIASDNNWIKFFEKTNLPIIGDDVKGTVGASVLSRTLVRLFTSRGCKIDRMYQLNFGGNTDFFNLLEKSRLKYKKISKTETVQSQMPKRLEDYQIHIGPSDYVSWLKSRKIAHIRIEGRTFGNIPINFDARLDVEDKSVSAGIVVDAVRCCKLALERNIGGILHSPSAYFMKHPPIQMSDEEARKRLEMFIEGKIER